MMAPKLGIVMSRYNSFKTTAKVPKFNYLDSKLELL